MIVCNRQPLAHPSSEMFQVVLQPGMRNVKGPFNNNGPHFVKATTRFARDTIEFCQHPFQMLDGFPSQLLVHCQPVDRS